MFICSRERHKYFSALISLFIPGGIASFTYLVPNMYLMLFSLVSTASTVAAMPGMAAMLEGRQSLPTLPLSQAQGNSGPFPSLQFNAADQFVDVRPGSAHQFIAPGPNDKRGPCPGLNAAANHGFLPRSGVTTIAQSKLLHLSHKVLSYCTNLYQLSTALVQRTVSDQSLPQLYQPLQSA